MSVKIEKLTPDEKKRALCLACERSLLSGQCKCVNPNWVLATEPVEPSGKGRVGLPFGKRAQLARPPRANKYNAQKTQALTSKRWFDSKAEADYRDVLTAREQAFEICDIAEQPVIDLGSGINYKPDFEYWELIPEYKSLEMHKIKHAKPTRYRDRRVWVEVKGFETERFRIIKKLWRHGGPGPLEIVKRQNAKSPFKVTQTIMPIT